MNKQFYKLAKLFNVIPLKVLMNLTNQKVIFPFYHTISDNNIIHIKHLYKVRSTKEFEKDLDFFLRNYKPLEINELLNSVKNNIPLNNNRFLLSFDDGLSEFHTVIAPILKRKGIPAICFLNSAFIDNKDLFFRYKASVLIEQLRSSEISNNKKKEIKTWFYNKKLIFNGGYNSLLSINYLYKHYLDELAQFLEFNFQEYLLEHKPYMTTEQINELTKQGFLFGAHSIDHPEYFRLNDEEQLLQTKKSIEEITEKFNLDYKLFSFPFTDDRVSKNFFDNIFNLNNPFVDITFGCAGLKHDSCSGNLQRIPIEINSFSAREIVYGEYIYYLFKALFNKNTVKRY